MKCRGNHDTTWTFPRSITFSPLHFMLYHGKSITFGTMLLLGLKPRIASLLLIFYLFSVWHATETHGSNILHVFTLFIKFIPRKLGTKSCKTICMQKFNWRERNKSVPNCHIKNPVVGMVTTINIIELPQPSSYRRVVSLFFFYHNFYNLKILPVIALFLMKTC